MTGLFWSSSTRLPHSVRYRTSNAQIIASFREFFSRLVTKTWRGKVPSPRDRSVGAFLCGAANAGFNGGVNTPHHRVEIIRLGHDFRAP